MQKLVELVFCYMNLITFPRIFVPWYSCYPMHFNTILNVHMNIKQFRWQFAPIAMFHSYFSSLETNLFIVGVHFVWQPDSNRKISCTWTLPIILNLHIWRTTEYILFYFQFFKFFIYFHRNIYLCFFTIHFKDSERITDRVRRRNVKRNNRKTHKWNTKA